MKVCHMTSAHNSHDVRIFKKECTSLAKQENLDVYLVACGDSRVENNVQVIGIGSMGSNRIKRSLFTAKKVFKQALMLDADVYHLHDPELLKYALKLKKKGKHVIFDSHENTYEQIFLKEWIPSALRSLVAKIYRKRETSICMQIDAVIIPDAIEEGHFFEYRCRKCISIDNVPKLEEVYDKMEGNSIAGKSDLSCIGSLTAERGIESLVDACFMANRKVILAGNFSPESFYDSLKEKKSFEAVDYRGYCNRDEVLSIIKSTRIGTSTILNIGQYSIATNLPTKVYEYMSAGIPIIMSRFPFVERLNEVLPFAVLVDPASEDEIASAIEKLNDDAFAEMLGKNGRKWIKDKFNWELEEAKLVDLYSSLDCNERCHV